MTTAPPLVADTATPLVPSRGAGRWSKVLLAVLLLLLVGIAPASAVTPASGFSWDSPPTWWRGTAEGWELYRAAAGGSANTAPPNAAPSSVYPNTGTAVARTNTVLQTRPYTNPATGKATFRVVSGVGALTKLGGPVATGVFGFSVGYEAGNSVARLVGFDEDQIGYENLVGEFFPTMHGEYAPNSDVLVLDAPGWTAAPAWEAFWTHDNGTTNLGAATHVANVDGWPAFGSVPYAGQVVQTASSYYATTASTVQLTPSATLQVWCSGPGGGWRNYNTRSLSMNAKSPRPLVTTITNSCGTGSDGYGFDRITLGASAAVQTPTGPVGDIATWFPVGHALRPPDSGGDPERVWEVRYQCTSGAPQASRSAAFRESGDWPSFPEVSCAGEPLWLEAWQLTLDGSADDVMLYRYEPSQGYQDWRQNFPECADGSCRLEVWTKDPSTGSRLSCFANPHACLDWYTDTARDTKYECTYAGRTVDIHECRTLAPTFNVATGTPVTNPDGTKSPAEDTSIIGDPATGDPVPTGSTGTGGSTAPQDCPPPFSFTAGGFGYWVTKGTSCALDAAFRPTQTGQQNLTRIHNALATTPPMIYGGAVAGLFDGLSVGSGDCRGPLLSWDFVGAEIYPFDACSGANANLATWTRRLAFVAVGLFGTMACLRAVGSGFGWKPSAGGDS